MALCIVLERENQLPHTSAVSTPCLSIPVAPTTGKPALQPGSV